MFSNIFGDLALEGGVNEAITMWSDKYKVRVSRIMRALCYVIVQVFKIELLGQVVT